MKQGYKIAFLRLLILFIGCVLVPSSLFAQYQRTVARGVTLEVIDGDTVPLPFVQVWFEGTTNGTTSDANGNFEISNTASMQTVSFSMVGYRKKLVRVKGERVIIRIRDDCRPFDPKKQAELYNPEDPTKHIGIRLVKEISTEFDYVNVLKLNNLIVKL